MSFLRRMIENNQKNSSLPNCAVDTSGASPSQSLLLGQFVETYEQLQGQPEAAACLVIGTPEGLQVEWRHGTAKSLHLHIDIKSFVRMQRSFPAPRQTGFNQALGRRSRRIVDATGGWGTDALRMCAQGLDVTIIERHPLMGLLLTDAMQRLSATDWAERNRVAIPRVVIGDSITTLQSMEAQADCVYLDPMYPLRRKGTAAVNKYMQFLQWLVGPDGDAAQLLTAALQVCKRVAVKRPDAASPIQANPDTAFSSKLVHYDVYLTRDNSPPDSQ
ncbi:MAG: class I SAM-dependent methyltransferase [Gammaproteobacteria bacterium]|nr:class I SAM-dependent methyltransferase [Gammaproteobacteria bacterium]